ncbi:MAG TPA: hypothetical protein VL463_30085 [Kofleriaceae bacterium]|nr:hypothetical protein [Kofleriaceae bacterium]
MRPLLFLLAFVSILAIARRADACPCCDPCSKYDYLMKQPPPEALADQYVAERAAPMSGHPKRAEVMKILTGVRFVASVKGVRKLRIVDAANVPTTIDHADAARTEIVHDLVAKHGHFWVTIGGMVYTVEPCTDGRKHASTCLIQVPAP